jgi:anaerobic magnesium-protoporphyrin IX monomethyl ester cyclase
MSSKVVLISPPFKKDYMRNARCDFVSLSSSSWFPIWLGMAGSYLEARGHKTKLLDSQVAKLTTQEAINQIDTFNPDIIAVYTGRLSEDNDIEFADQICKDGRIVVLVGPYASIDPDNLLGKTKKCSLLIKKEFDLPLEELASGQNIKSIKNIVYKDSNGEIIHNDTRPLITTEILDSFPMTAKYFHEQINIRDYKTTAELYPFIDVMSGRGCAWGKCNFCLWVQSFVPGSVYNLRSIEHFMGEFDYIVNKIPEIKSVMIQDDMITNKRAIEISESILRRGYKINWSCYAKPNSNLTQETLHLMKRSGCLNLHVGFESGDDEVLKKMDKGSNVEQAIKFAEMAHKANLHIHADFSLGHLGETKESMDATIKLAKQMNPHTAQFQIMIPFKKTKFWNQLESNNLFNTVNEPDYSAIGGPSAEEIRSTAKKAYRKFYLSPSHFKKILSNPNDYLFNRIDQYLSAIPAVTWKKWDK